MVPAASAGTSGRGGSFYSSFKLETNWQDLPVEANGRVYQVNVAWLTGEASLQRPDD